MKIKMAMIKVKGHEFNALVIKDSSSRRALQFKNNIIATLRQIGVTEDDIDVPLERIAIKRCPATISWYASGYYLHYTYKAAAKYVDNLYIISKVIEHEVNDFMNGVKTADEFLREFSEDHDVAEQRNEARKLLGVEEDCTDLELISKNYKKLAKTHHPDLGGDMIEFKKINHAHKMLKRELE